MTGRNCPWIISISVKEQHVHTQRLLNGTLCNTAGNLFKPLQWEIINLLSKNTAVLHNLSCSKMFNDCLNINKYIFHSMSRFFFIASAKLFAEFPWAWIPLLEFHCIVHISQWNCHHTPQVLAALFTLFTSARRSHICTRFGCLIFALGNVFTVLMFSAISHRHVCYCII